MNQSFHVITNLEYRLKAALAKVDAFQSGDAYTRLNVRHEKERCSLVRKIKILEDELATANQTIIAVRNQWFEVFEDLQKESERTLNSSKKRNLILEKRARKAEQQLEDALDKVKKQRLQIYELETALEKEVGKNIKLTAQINRDYENSSQIGRAHV